MMERAMGQMVGSGPVGHPVGVEREAEAEARVLAHRRAARKAAEMAVQVRRLRERLGRFADAREAEAAGQVARRRRFEPQQQVLAGVASDPLPSATALARDVDRAIRDARAAHRGLFRLV